MDKYSWHNLSEDDRAQLWASLALRHSQGIGPRFAARILKHFGSAFTAINNLDKWGELGIGEDKISQVAAGAWRESALVEWRLAQSTNAHILLWHHEEFPELLRTIIDAPVMLYARGDLSLLAGACLAVVGSRKCTAEGVLSGGNITRDLADAGITIVSGMAQGIDRVAHVAALHKIGRSIAVLGTGIDVIYPTSNTDIYNDLAEHGLIISEFAPSTPPIASNFPVRNRIISGISLGVLVVEGSLRSGTLITARQALEQNRDVFAIPGPTSAESSHGCQELIRQGAKVVFKAEDILIDMSEQLKACTLHLNNSHANSQDLTKPNNTASDAENALILQNFSAEEYEDIKKILKFLYAQGESNVDNLCEALEKNVAEINSLLMGMELAGLIKRLPGARFVAQSALA